MNDPIIWQRDTTASTADTQAELKLGPGEYEILSAHLNTASLYANQAGISVEQELGDGTTQEHILIDGYIKLHIGLSIKDVRIFVPVSAKMLFYMVKEDASTSRCSIMYRKIIGGRPPLQLGL